MYKGSCTKRNHIKYVHVIIILRIGEILFTFENVQCSIIYMNMSIVNGSALFCHWLIFFCVISSCLFFICLQQKYGKNDGK